MSHASSPYTLSAKLRILGQRLLTTPAVGAGLLGMACGAEADPGLNEAVDQRQSPIINGDVVSAAARAQEGLVDLPGCSGSLYKNDWVLTALHCVDRTDPGGGIPVSFDDNSGAPQTQFTDRFIEFGPDVALLHVPVPFRFRGATTGFVRGLTGGAPSRDTAVTCYGKGYSAFSPGGGLTASGTWRYAVLTVAGNSGSFFWATPNSRMQIAAPGDSGGPCFISFFGGTALAGVVSSGGIQCQDRTTKDTCERTATGITHSWQQAVGLQATQIEDRSSQGISILRASYGSNCGRALDATASVQTACKGKRDCDFPVDHQVLGDPAVGCAKDFTAAYRCAGSDTIRTMRVPAEASGRTASIRCSGITVLRATYGMNLIQSGTISEGYLGMATGALTSCNNPSNLCRYTVDARRFEDPAPGMPKTLAVDYVCHGEIQARNVTTFGEANGQTLYLTCP